MKNLSVFGEKILHFRWLLMTMLGVMISCYEITRHGQDEFHKLEFDLVLEILLMGVFMPLLAGYLLTKLKHSRADSARSTASLGQYKELFQELTQQRELGELIRFLVRYPAEILPVQHADLYLYDHQSARLELAAGWDACETDSVPQMSPDPQICRVCLSSWNMPFHPSSQCPFRSSYSADGFLVSSDYCLALSYHKVLVGTLHLTCPPGKSITPAQIEFMNFIMPELALALAVAIASPRQIAHVRLQTQFMERQQTALDLHNTLAQQLGFLHLSLDQLAADERRELDPCLRAELERMRLTAADVYQQVRDRLTILQPVGPADLTQAIVDYSFKVAQRAHLQNGFTTVGYPVQIPVELRRRIFSIVQEGLNNIEKYAQARSIHVSVVWAIDRLTISLQDDGVGFDISMVQTEGHYGIMMMRELVKNTQGHFEIISSPGQGTTLNFGFPLLYAKNIPAADQTWLPQSYASAELLSPVD